MALQKFTDAAGREAYLDPATNEVYTNKGKTDTFYKKDAWNERQTKKYGASSKASSPETDYASKTLAAVNDQIKQQTNFLDKFTKKNPFTFDEALAKESATAEYVPYYTELLQDYLDTTNLKRTTINNDITLLKDLKSYNEGKTSREYTQAVDKASKGYADSGMFFSGIKKKAIGQMEVGNLADTGAANTQFQHALGDYNTRLDTLGLGETQQKRDLARQQEEAIQGGILTRANEATKAYNTNMSSTYSRQFPSSSSSALTGYIIPDYLKYSSIS